MAVDLLTALAAGLIVGLAARAVPAWRHLPFWLAPAIGSVAAAAATLALHATGTAAGGQLRECFAQTVFAGLAVLVAGRKAGGKPARSR
ncbi:hypothetical protein [Paractinoplanes atraurantiacus]|uniref:Uncharacterized protein n=1 Tax=Paractinoplanes atraurantiacus TaxID=1036182 RepID=A0A285GPV9_9ACTN|nr:hypothetical protein [Actinoplanes atraurantiacus]SNY25602.1 hypothetical protein SAMN05421748_102372 [Actinoplanes atraurantiacus]